jgi:putative ABC transport system permease protein
LEEVYDYLEFYLTEELGQNNVVLQFLGTLSWATSGIALVVAFIVILNTLLMSVTERVREFGIFAAAGWTPERIGAVVLVEALFLSAIGSVAGILLGWVTMNAVARMPFILAIEPAIEPGLLLAVAGVTVMMGLIAGFYPAWTAARQRPVEAIGHL